MAPPWPAKRAVPNGLYLEYLRAWVSFCALSVAIVHTNSKAMIEILLMAILIYMVKSQGPRRVLAVMEDYRLETEERDELPELRLDPPLDPPLERLYDPPLERLDPLLDRRYELLLRLGLLDPL